MRRITLIMSVIVLCSFVFAADDDIFAGERFSEEGFVGQRKSTLAAMGLSLLLPGAGELYLGEKRTAIPLIVADGVIWTLAAGFGIYGTWRSNEYRSFAQKYANVDVNGKDTEFFKLIALWSSRDSYNYYLLLTERDESLLFPETDEWNWYWRNESDQLQFYELWTSSQHAWQRFKVSLAAAGINRIISVINVIRISRRGAPGWSISAKTYPDGKNRLGLSLCVERKF